MKLLMLTGTLMGALMTAAWVGVPADEPDGPAVASESFLPRNAFAAFQSDGNRKHQPAISETASWKALRESQLHDRVLDLLQMFISVADPQLGLTARNAVEHLSDNGFSFAASVSGSGEGVSPYVIVVLNRGAEIAPQLEVAVQKLVSSGQISIQQTQVDNRRINSVVSEIPGVEVSWWTESGHLIIVAGMNAVEQVIATVNAPDSNIRSSPRWMQLSQAEEFAVNQFGWIDTGSLLKQFGEMPFPEPPGTEPMNFRQFLELIALENVSALTMQSGFDGTRSWSNQRVEVEGELSGILSLLKQEDLSLAELPPMPADNAGFAAAKFDLTRGIDTVMEIVDRIAARIGPRAQQDVADFRAEVIQSYGSDPRQDVVQGFGNVWCVYSDPASLPIPIGAAPVAVVSVADRDKLLNGINKLIRAVEPMANQQGVTLRQSWKDGNFYISLGIPNLPLFPTMLLTEKWLVFSITPASAQSFVLRESGRLPSWKPSAQVAEAIAELPASYSAISVSDPAPGYRQLLTFAPMGLGLLESQLPNLTPQPIPLPFGVEEIPPAELVTAPMFPNVSVAGLTSKGWESWSRQSVPSNPLGSITSVSVAPILVALLLPAVQQAREAARRTQSKNNLKQLALAMHNYHDVYNHFPRGTVDAPDLPVEERMSWIVPLLPYMEQTNLYEHIAPHVGRKWDGRDSPELEILGATTIHILQNPSMPRRDASPSSMDYVGIAGVGANAAELPNMDPKAGVFGYNRVVRIRDITDGTSNTLMIGDASEPNKSFLAGGSETVRGFSQKPYLNGPDRIGSPHRGIVQFVLADGSVRAISTDIDESVLEALATKSGGEVIGDF